MKEMWKRVKDNPSLKDQLAAAEVDRVVLKRDQTDFQNRIDELNELKDNIYAQKSEVDRNLGITKKTIKCLRREIERDAYIYNPTALVIDTDPGNFIPCEYSKYDEDRWIKGSLRGYSPESSAPYKIANKPSSRWARNVRIRKEDWADYVNRIAPPPAPPKKTCNHVWKYNGNFEVCSCGETR